MSETTVRIAMGGVTGRMGYRQYLVRSILAIRDEGGLRLPDGTVLMPEPVLLGRDAERLAAIAKRHDIADWSTDLDSVLADPSVQVYFDAQVTTAREAALRK